MFVYSAVVKCPIAGSQWREYGGKMHNQICPLEEKKKKKHLFVFVFLFFSADGEAHLGFNICFIVSPYAEHLV